MPQKKKTAAQRAAEALELVLNVTGTPLPGTPQYQELLKKLTLSYKEQDRDTRHACAENVLTCFDYNESNGDSDLALIERSEAHNACMNTNIT